MDNATLRLWNDQLGAWETYRSVPSVDSITPPETIRSHDNLDDSVIPVPRGDLGLLYQVLKDLEWSAARTGCRLAPDAINPPFMQWEHVVANACPRCGGVHPDQFDPILFPSGAFSHASDCTLVAMIRLLRSALGAID